MSPEVVDISACNVVAEVDSAVMSWKLAANPVSVRKTLIELDAHISEKINVSKGRRENAQIVLAEVLNNIVEHAYGPDRGGFIKVQIEKVDAALAFTIHDFGRPMKDQKLPQPKTPVLSKEREDLSEGGYGSYIVQLLCEKLDYVRNGDENVLTLRI